MPYQSKDNKMKKVLITGANGFVGCRLFEMFSALRYYIIPFTRKDNIKEIHELSPNIVIHCAAETKNSELMLESNVSLTYDVLEQCRLLDCLDSVIYIGSSSEYGRKSQPMKETDSLEPDSIYEATKACGSMLTRAYAKTYGIPANVVRPFTLYGPRESINRFIPLIYRNYINKTRMKINRAVHDFLYIDDFIEGILAVISRPEKILGDSINFGTGIQTTNEEIVALFEDIMGQKIEYDIIDNGVGIAGIDSMCWVANIQHAHEIYGWVPKTSLQEGITKYVQYRKSIE
jgi:nucleoside-diphosphate-sugar epimerase